MFPTDKAHEAEYTDALKRIASHGGQVVNLDLLEAALAINREVNTGGATIVNNDPPAVMFSFEPARSSQTRLERMGINVRRVPGLG